MFMLATAALALVLPMLAPPPALLAACRAVALAAFCLWLAHVAAFALRAAPPDTDAHRRSMLAFGRGLLLAAAATALPVHGAWAAIPCGDHCNRLKRDDCFTCCSCGNRKDIRACKSFKNPDKYNDCVKKATTSLANCQKSCK
ncbi:MAG: hypothetical protein NTV97_01880 [Alphaproteobacteria bacterium]|nr:hypothetical protein [Alphaproteobacteria bacterium]